MSFSVLCLRGWGSSYIVKLLIMIRLRRYWVLWGARGFSAVCMGIGICAGFGFEALFVARLRDSTCWSFSGCVGYLAP